MTTALWLMAVQGAIGAFDTVYYHEWRARLPARGTHAAAELKLHACRDFLYALIFGTLPWLAWQGVWAVALLAVFVAEILLTMADFLVEIRVWKPIGDVYGGERLLTDDSTKWPEPSIDDYSERTRQTVTAWKGMSGLQGGDPAKLARALVQLASLAEPPSRWPAGADAAEAFEKKGRDLLAEANAHRALSSSLAHDDARK